MPSSIFKVARIATAGIAAAAFAGYQSMAPTSQGFGRTFFGLPRGTKQIALTYDDGPNDPHTLRLIEVLAKHEVQATFFLIGRYVQRRPDIVRVLLQAGHVLANHTFNHPNLIFASTAQTRIELEYCQSALRDACGESAKLFRPPFGGRNPNTLRVARKVGLDPIMWNVTGWDWKARAADYVEQKVNQQVRGGDIILLHDGGHKALGADRSQTVIATDHLLTRYKSQGYTFVTVPSMMAEFATAASVSGRTS